MADRTRRLFASARGGRLIVEDHCSALWMVGSMNYIRSYYGVPARRGGRVRYYGGEVDQMGTIMSARGGYLRIQLDGHGKSFNFHPTWKLEYL